MGHNSKRSNCIQLAFPLYISVQPYHRANRPKTVTSLATYSFNLVSCVFHMGHPDNASFDRLVNQKAMSHSKVNRTCNNSIACALNQKLLRLSPHPHLASLVVKPHLDGEPARHLGQCGEAHGASPAFDSKLVQFSSYIIFIIYFKNGRVLI